jgi:endonuclease/exonuclease/phosphatase family metal-dependent hydrolase
VVTTLAAARLGMQLQHPIEPWVAMIAVAVGVGALALLLHASRARRSGAGAAVAIVVGLAVDAAIRGAYETWDPVWQTGSGPTILAAALAGVLIAAALATRIEPDTADREPDDAGVLLLATIGPFLLLQTLFLQNAAFIASEYGVSITAAVAWVMAGNVLAAAVAVQTARDPSLGRSWITRSIVAVVVVGSTIALATSSLNVVVLGQLASTVLLVWAVARPVAGPEGAWRTCSAIGLGMALFVGLAFAYQIDIDVPLPLPRATWPILASILLAAAAVPRPSADPATLSRRIWVIPLALLAAVGTSLVLRAPSLEPVGPDELLRVVSWNIHTAVNGDGNVDLGAIADAIERQDPDVVLLQEVGRGWPIAGQTDQAEWLSRRLDMAFSWTSAADDQFGNAILTRLPVLEEGDLRLPYGEGPQYRSALRVRAMGFPGEEVWFVDVHLQNGAKERTREDQIVALLDAWGRDHPLVLGGDLNMEPAEANAALFGDAALTSVQDAVGDPSTSTAREPEFPGNRVDWIWVSDDLEPQRFEIVWTPASDHLPLVADLGPGGP